MREQIDSLYAQNRLVPADSVVRLRAIWSKGGKDLTADHYGRNVWGGFDLDGDSIGDFGVYRGSTNQWLFYAGGNPPDTAAMWVIDSASTSQSIFADFHLWYL